MDYHDEALKRLQSVAKREIYAPLKYYRVGYFEVGDYFGASLDVTFAAHSLEEAYLKIRGYFLIYATEYGRNDILDNHLDILFEDIDDEDDINVVVNKILTEFTDNDTLWIYEVTEPGQYIL
jgi:hypothetical protein